MFPRIREWGALFAADSTCRLQPSLWDLFRNRTANSLVDDGYFRFWDFDNWGDQTASTTYLDGFKCHLDTGDTIVQVTNENYGVLRPTTTTTDNNSIDLMFGGNVGSVAITSAGTQHVAFDCRVRFTQVTNTYNAFFGLTASGSAADNGFFSDAGATADRGCFGFTVLEADGDALEFTYKKASQTAQITSGLKAIAAATWYRLGAIFDPTERNPAHRVKIFIDDAEVGYLSDTNLAAATFPSAVLMNFGMSLKNQTTVGKSWDIDCAAVAMAA